MIRISFSDAEWRELLLAAASGSMQPRAWAREALLDAAMSAAARGRKDEE